MKSSTTPDFWESYARLQPEVRVLAKRAYRIWKTNPRHPSLCFKRIGDFWAIRIGIGHRALAVQQNQVLYWFWIGDHDEYERLLRGS